MAQRVQSKGVPVIYLATFDPTQTFTVPGDARYFANFYKNNGRRASFKRSQHKEKVKLNLSSPGLNDCNMDRRRLHDIVIARIRQDKAR